MSACAERVLRVVDPQDPVLAGLIGWWRFDDGPGSAVVRDASGHANEGTLMDLDAAAAVTWPEGHDGSSLELRGAGYANVPLSDSIQSISDQVTVAAWIYFEGSVTQRWGTAISRQISGTVDQHYHLSLNQAEIPSLWITAGDNPILLTGPTATPRFTWTHLAGTYDGFTARLYVDGVLVDSGSQTQPGLTIRADSTPVILGANGNQGVGITERFPGRVDEIMLYRRALGANEITQLSGQ